MYKPRRRIETRIGPGQESWIRRALIREDTCEPWIRLLLFGRILEVVLETRLQFVVLSQLIRCPIRGDLVCFLIRPIFPIPHGMVLGSESPELPRDIAKPGLHNLVPEVGGDKR